MRTRTRLAAGALAALALLPVGTARAGLITYTVTANLTYNSNDSNGIPDTLGLDGATVTEVLTIDSGATASATVGSTSVVQSIYENISATLTISGASVATTNGTFTSNDQAPVVEHGLGANPDGFGPWSNRGDDFTVGGLGAFFSLFVDLPRGTVPFSGGVAGLPLFPAGPYDGNLNFRVRDSSGGTARYDASDIQASGIGPEVTGVPEPAGLTLLATGALGLLGYGRRRRQAA
jgi:hypothetical protein